MIDRRLLKEMQQTKHLIYKQVFMQWLSLLCNIVFVMILVEMLNNLYKKTFETPEIWLSIGVVLLLIVTRMVCIKKASMYAYTASRDVKDQMRERLYKKILQLKNTYQTYISTSELIQLNVEGIDQLEAYFGRYLPQFFYSLLAPLTLFAILVWFDIKSAFILLLCVPMIPLSIIAVQKIAKKLLARYWTSYAALGDHFLENLQGLTTLKTYQADEYMNIKMNEEAEHFRKITMKVLIMQLNSISVMDVIAYGGATIGSIVAILGYMNETITLFGVICIILLSAEFFIPLRLLGSYFHIAMNGIAASKKIFRILDLDVTEEGKSVLSDNDMHIEFEHVSFAYDDARPILHDITLKVKPQQFIGIIGESGSGKSTIAKIIAGFACNYHGSMRIKGKERSFLNDSSFYDQVVYITHKPVILKDTLKRNLIMGNAMMKDEDCWNILDKLCMKTFVEERGGLEMLLLEDGKNLSGGQKQRISIARAILANRELYIFDEATSNIDIESEEAILNVIKELTRHKTVIMITHRLQNVMHSNCIFVLQQGVCIEEGTHNELMNMHGQYHHMFKMQQSLENLKGEMAYAKS